MEIRPDPATETEFLSASEAATELGVHVNTIRNWARNGTLRSSRVSGSRPHRFAREDIKRLGQQRGAVPPSARSNRLALGPDLVDANQLDQWARTHEARRKFPLLLRRLLAATPGVSNISVRTGEGVDLPGWDGRADANGAPFLPSGNLFFELGTGSRVKSKADEDFEKRRADPVGADPTRSIFVFVTPRRWADAANWAAERRAEEVFADVRVLDADDVEGWLVETPSVHYWLSEELGRRPREAETLERWWRKFSGAADPPLPAELFLAGREQTRERLAAFLTGPAGVLPLRVPWSDEAIAFTYAAISSLESEKERIGSVLTVKTPAAWERIVAQDSPTHLIPLFPDVDVEQAVENGHHVVLAAGSDDVVSHQALDLGRPHRSIAAEALREAGLSFEKADRLAGLARRSMPALIRSLARDPRYRRPEWSVPPSSDLLAPLLLVGSWATNSADTAAVARVVGAEWEEVERRLLHWRQTDDPPFTRSGQRWQLASPEQAFLLFRESLTEGALARWNQVAKEILLEPDPTLEIPITERPFAGIRGISQRYSPALREGVARALALLGANAESPLASGNEAGAHAERIVAEVLARANEQSDGSLWQSLSDVLPLLAEAAPDAFVAAVEFDLDQPSPQLKTLFQDEKQGSALFGSSPHTGLLWALETVCWSSSHLVEATDLLARLDELDPGGRLSNRPSRSLAEVLVAWVRHTSAPLDVRLQAVNAICRHHPHTGWKLLLALWPQSHATASPPSRPRFRDWMPESQSVPGREWFDFTKGVVELATALAANDARRFAKLISRLGPVPPLGRDHVLDALEGQLDAEVFRPHDILELWQALEDEVSSHREHADADWALSETSLGRMDAIAKRIEPADRSERFAYLFDWRVSRKSDLSEEELARQRVEVLQACLRERSIEGVEALIGRSPAPLYVGATAASIEDGDLTSAFLSWLDSDETKLREAAVHWAGNTLYLRGVAWLAEALCRGELIDDERRLTLVQQGPATEEFWSALEALDPELSERYWRSVKLRIAEGDDLSIAIERLLEHDRPWCAVDLLVLGIHIEESPRPGIESIERVLEAACQIAPDGTTHQPGYDAGLLLDELERQDPNSASLIRFEFLLSPLLEGYRKPRALFREMAADPAFFVSLVERVFKPKQGRHQQKDEREQALAHRAWEILDSWNEIPGAAEDGRIDRDHLKRWVKKARLALTESDRADIGDEQIGQLLSVSSVGEDEIWPAEPVRDLIEMIGSPSLETGFHVGVINRRGITSRAIYAGGDQEREFAAKYRRWADATSRRWPRTSRVLRGLADSYEREARREDLRAEADADSD